MWLLALCLARGRLQGGEAAESLWKRGVGSSRAGEGSAAYSSRFLAGPRRPGWGWGGVGTWTLWVGRAARARVLASC